MFTIAHNLKGVAAIITDNPKIAELIHEEDIHVPVWFVGAPTKETARAIADGLTKEFGMEASFRTGGHCAMHACFTK